MKTLPRAAGLLCLVALANPAAATTTLTLSATILVGALTVLIAP